MRNKLQNILLLTLILVHSSCKTTAISSLKSGNQPDLSISDTIKNQDYHCQVPETTWESIEFQGSASDREPVYHGDLNPYLSGFNHLNGPEEPLFLNDIKTIRLNFKHALNNSSGPFIDSLVHKGHNFNVVSAYSAFVWDWSLNGGQGGRKNGNETIYNAQVVGIEVNPEDQIFTPNHTLDKNQTGLEDYMAIVLYAGESSLTLKFNREDNVVNGLTMHLTGFCVNPSLVNAYTSLANTPQRLALKPNQVIGIATANEFQVMMRHTGQLLRILTRPDWWSPFIRNYGRGNIR